MADSAKPPVDIAPPPIRPVIPVQPPLRRLVYHKLLVITNTSESLRVTFDACEGSDESHYWDHHAGFTETHITELFKLESDDESKISGILPENEFEVDLEFNGTIILSDAPEPRLNPVLRNIPEPRLNPVLRDTPEPRLNPVLRNAPEPTRGSVLNGIPKLFGFLNETSFETKIATFMPALARFRNKEPWYLTVVEDSLGVRLHPTFLPISEDNKSGSAVWHTDFIFSSNDSKTWAVTFKAANTNTRYQLVPSTTRIETQQFTSAEPTEYCFVFG